MFSGWIRMHPQCQHCGLKYERGPGFFLGSIYVNYGLTAISTTIMFVALRFGANIPGQKLVWPLALYCVVFPMFFFRYARAYWLAMDCYFDREDPDDFPEE